MKKLLALVLTGLLASCGGDTSAPQESTIHDTMVVQRSLTKEPVIKPGELRAYELVWEQGKLTGKSKVLELGDFELSTPEVRLQDISVAFDADSAAGQLYRLYQAAFGRAPDVAGLGFWKDALENKGVSLTQVGNDFLKSTESKSLYGENVSDSLFIEKLYQNVLGRTPDNDGRKFWENALRNGTDRVSILLGFSNSAENIAALQAITKKGMYFAEPGVSYIPVANAAPIFDALVGSYFTLDGSVSTDANSDTLHYSWSITAQPYNSRIAFSNPNIAKPFIQIDKPGQYEFTLWVNDGKAQSYSPAKIKIFAHDIVSDTGNYLCTNLTVEKATALYASGHTYLDRNKDGIVCNGLDHAYEKSPPVPAITDSGIYKCSTLSRQTAILLYLQGHTYLDRDRDGKPCESTDIDAENPIYTPTPAPSPGRMCWVNGYRKKNGTYVSGYYRRC